MIAPKPMMESQTKCRILAVTSSQATVASLHDVETKLLAERGIPGAASTAPASLRCCEFDFRAVEIVTRAVHQSEPYAVVVVDTQQIPETLAEPLINALHHADLGLQILVLATHDTAICRQLLAVSGTENRLTVQKMPCEKAELRQMLSMLCSKWAGEWQTRRLRTELESIQPRPAGTGGGAFNLDAVGSLATGIAHEFNNVLTVIQNQIDLALQQPGNSQELAGLLGQVMETARNASALSRKLVRLSPSEFGPPEEMDLVKTVNDEAALLGKTLGEDISLRVEHAEGLPPVRVPAGLVSQMILNVAVHARRTMPQGGSLHFGTRRVAHETGNRNARHFPKARHGDYVLLTIEDPNPGSHVDSAGASEAGNDRLAWIQENMDACGGAFNATLVPGMVKIYELLFPLAGSEARQQNAKTPAPVMPPAPAPANSASNASATILVVDDDETISLIMSQVLGTRSHRTIIAHNADEAWRQWQQCRNSVHMVITDINMPGGANGVALAEAIKEDDASVPIIYTSGHRATAIYPHLKPGVNYLPKPFGMNDLLKIVEANLASRQNHGMI